MVGDGWKPIVGIHRAEAPSNHRTDRWDPQMVVIVREMGPQKISGKSIGEGEIFLYNLARYVCLHWGVVFPTDTLVASFFCSQKSRVLFMFPRVF